MPLVTRGIQEWGAKVSTKVDPLKLPDDPDVKTRTTAFYALAAREVAGPDTVCVLQREAGVTESGKQCRYLGSVEATTCVIAFAWVRYGSGPGDARALCAHLDDASEAFPSFLSLLSTHILKPLATAAAAATATSGSAGGGTGPTVEISLVGSYDPSQCEALQQALRGLHSEVKGSPPLLLRIAAVGASNSVRAPGTPAPKPRVSAAVIDVLTGELYPVRTAARSACGPCQVRRRARLWASDQGNLHLAFDGSKDVNVEGGTEMVDAAVSAAEAAWKSAPGAASPASAVAAVAVSVAVGVDAPAASTAAAAWSPAWQVPVLTRANFDIPQLYLLSLLSIRRAADLVAETSTSPSAEDPETFPYWTRAALRWVGDEYMGLHAAEQTAGEEDQGGGGGAGGAGAAAKSAATAAQAAAAAAAAPTVAPWDDPLNGEAEAEEDAALFMADNKGAQAMKSR